MNKRLNFNNCYVLGPTGPKGVDGNKIIVERTITLDEDISTKVIDRVDGNIHNLEFRIPRGKVEQVIILLMDINLVMLELLMILKYYKEKQSV